MEHPISKQSAPQHENLTEADSSEIIQNYQGQRPQQ